MRVEFGSGRWIPAIEDHSSGTAEETRRSVSASGTALDDRLPHED
jgi:hypothetical protein